MSGRDGEPGDKSKKKNQPDTKQDTFTDRSGGGKQPDGPPIKKK